MLPVTIDSPVNTSATHPKADTNPASVDITAKDQESQPLDTADSTEQIDTKGSGAPKEDVLVVEGDHTRVVFRTSGHMDTNSTLPEQNVTVDTSHTVSLRSVVIFCTCS